MGSDRSLTKTLTFTLDELVILGNALAAMPYRQVAALFNGINAQLAEQNDEPGDEEKPGDDGGTGDA